MSNYKVGDLVKVIGNSTDHGFPIGEIVRVASVYGKDVDACELLDGSEHWFVGEHDVELQQHADVVAELDQLKAENASLLERVKWYAERIAKLEGKK
jgi:hypothetical protein